MPKADTPSERRLQRQWARQEPSASALATPDGRPVRVLFPGWPNTDSGPDFLGALIERADGRLLHGDVELHLAPSGWRQHGHHRDPAYSKVVLHVLWQGGSSRTDLPAEAITYRPNISPDVAPLPIADDARPCVHSADAWDDAAIGGFLDREGEGRFAAKASSLAAAIAAQGAEEALHTALCEALGYAKNIEAFRALAERMPRAQLRAAAYASPQADRLEIVEALLFGAAGLLPAQRGIQGDAYATRLEALWRAHAPAVPAPALPWRAFRVRPENAPPRRIAALARLLAGNLEGGLSPTIEVALSAAAREGAASSIARALTVTAEGYWARHADLGAPCAESPTLLGKARAAEIVVNIVLPFFSALAHRRADASLAEQCRRLYGMHPPLAENHITERMEALLLPGRARTIVTTARRQQGLIGLYKSRCFALRCRGCAFAAPA